MYFPYFRCKQNELIALREMAAKLSAGPVTPILEPVKENLSGLQKCLEALKKANTPFILIVNPMCGDLVGQKEKIVEEIVEEALDGYSNFQIGYIVNKSTQTKSLISDLKGFDKNVALIHYGYSDGQELAAILKSNGISIATHIFIEGYAGRVYRNHFKGKTVLIHDCFKKRKNADHETYDDEVFSELHLTYKEEGVSGFGDFLIVGDDYSESGGPAYAVAIHLTYFGKEKIIYIRHFVSDNVDSPTDPAGKFIEALKKLVKAVDAANSPILKTSSVNEFKQLYVDKHFPGLGYVKKLSMQHHLELMLDYLE